MESKNMRIASGAPMALSARRMNWWAKLEKACAMSSDTSTGSMSWASGSAEAMRLSASSSRML
eukprot:7298848-Pyramimonas_sp.AAC.1